MTPAEAKFGTSSAIFFHSAVLVMAFICSGAVEPDFGNPVESRRLVAARQALGDLDALEFLHRIDHRHMRFGVIFLERFRILWLIVQHRNFDAAFGGGVRLRSNSKRRQRCCCAEDNSRSASYLGHCKASL